MPRSEGGADPFLRWVGGKRWLAADAARYARNLGCTRVVEPFLGAGSVGLRTGLPLVAGDVIPDLIDLWNAVQHTPTRLEAAVRRLDVSRSSFDALRREKPRTAFRRAVRFLYLNRASYGGVYRVNRRGEYNVPFGFTFDRSFLPANRIEPASRVLSTAQITQAPYEETIARASANDFLFVDPPYVVTGKAELGFRRFSPEPFGSADLDRAVSLAVDAASRGITVMLCLAYDDDAEHADELLAANWTTFVERKHRSGHVERIWVSDPEPA